MIENLLIWLGYTGYSIPVYVDSLVVSSWYILFLIGMFLLFRMPKSLSLYYRGIVALIMLFLALGPYYFVNEISSFTKCDKLQATLEYNLNGEHFSESKDKYVCYHRIIGSDKWLKD